ncbi:helix-turn-helix domain-containing protein [Xanthomarina spongicola]|uniref:Excisionase family DNA binding protein n=1 Tax=Xanthomarina spongicola TaxID=570520 RepID=A0A316DN85_9FLAO|nr:helix-turn-helix domain-containing protein [Xanthomarina spongicola]PWK19637.1 excisionase family DNA binding protein [Xanthomarina spongicola]
MITKTIQIQEVTIDELAEKVADKLLLKIENYLLKIGATKNEVLLTRQETADYFKVSLVTIHQWVKYGILTPVRFGNRVYFKKQVILDLIDKQTTRIK